MLISWLSFSLTFYFIRTLVMDLNPIPVKILPGGDAFRSSLSMLATGLTLIWILSCTHAESHEDLSMYIDPTIGNVSRFLVPTYPTFHLPNQMVRMHPQKKDYISDEVEAFPLQVAGHSNKGLFPMKVGTGKISEKSWQKKMYMDQDLEIVHPWHYSTYLIEDGIRLSFTPAKKSAMFRIDFPEGTEKHLLIQGSDDLRGHSTPERIFRLVDKIRYKPRVGVVRLLSALADRDR